MLLWGILKGWLSGQWILAAASALSENSPTRACWPGARRLLAAFLEICYSVQTYWWLHNRPINWETSWWGKKWWLTWRACWLRRWWTGVPKNRFFAWIRNQAPFLLREAGVKPSVSWSPSASGGMCSWLPPAAIPRWAWSGWFLGPKQGYFSLMLIYLRGGFPEMDHYV